MYLMTRDDFLQEGDGVFFRDPGKLQPDGRRLLAEVGGEEITSIEIVRTPLSSFTRGFLNVISLGQFDKISQKFYDQMFHLSLWINGKYNLEKNEVVYFNRKNPREANSQVKVVSKIPQGLTIQELIDNTIKRMGPQNFSEYDAEKLNCQNFLINVLDGSNIGDSADRNFIFQDATKIFKELPEYAKVLGKASTNLGAIFNRLIKGEGYVEDQEGYGIFGDPVDWLASEANYVAKSIGNLGRNSRIDLKKEVEKYQKGGCDCEMKGYGSDLYGGELYNFQLPRCNVKF